MNTDTAPVGAIPDARRAGFWRRSIATVIDAIIVIVPFQVLAAILFAVTAGGIQMNSGLFHVCETATTVPKSLDPPPPHDSNFANACRVSVFGATTGSTLIVGRTTREGNVTTTVTQGYMLDANGNPIQGRSIDWIVQLAFLVYLIAMVWKTGRTLGARALGVKVVNAAQPGGPPGVPLGQVIIRYLAMAIGFVPMFAVLIYESIVSGGNADAMFIQGTFAWFMAAGALAVLWSLVLIVQIARKRDPVYDRLAGTAVLRS
jgi:uncharacterized RDD family membrane protein YckC